MSEEAVEQISASNTDDHQVENTTNTGEDIGVVEEPTITNVDEQTNIIEPATSEETTEENTSIIIEEQSTSSSDANLQSTTEPSTEQQQVTSPTSETNFDNGDWLDGDSFATTDEQHQTVYNNDQSSTENTILEQTSTNQSEESEVIDTSAQSTTDEQQQSTANVEPIIEEPSDKPIANSSSQEDFGEYTEDSSEPIVIGETPQEEHSSQDVNIHDMEAQPILRETTQEGDVNIHDTEAPLESVPADVSKSLESHSDNFDEFTQPTETSNNGSDEGFSNSDGLVEAPTTTTETNLEESPIIETTTQEKIEQSEDNITSTFTSEEAHESANVTEFPTSTEETIKSEESEIIQESSAIVETSTETALQEEIKSADIEDFEDIPVGPTEEKSQLPEDETVQDQKETQPAEQEQGFADNDDFGDFPQSTTVETTNPTEEVHHEGFVDNDDFGDFPQPTTVETVETTTIPTEEVHHEGFADNNDFGESTEIVDHQFSQETQSINGFSQEDFGEFPSSETVVADTTVHHLEENVGESVDSIVHNEISQPMTAAIGFDDSDFGEFPEVAEPSHVVKGFGDDDDDFGDFPQPTTVETTANPTEEVHHEGFADNDDFGELPKPSSIENKPEQIEAFADNEDFGEFPTEQPNSQHVIVEETVTTFGNETVSQEDKFANDDFGDFPSALNEETSQLPQDESTSQPAEQEQGLVNDDDFGDFPQPTTVETTSNPTEEVHHEGFADSDDFGDFPAAVESTNTAAAEDDFGDFAEPTTEQPNTTPEVDQNTNNNSEEEFGDFEEPTQEATNKEDEDFGGFGEPTEEEEPVAKPVEINYADLLKDQKHVIDSILLIDQIKNEEEFSKVKQSVHNLVSMLIPNELAAGNQERSSLTGESGNTLEKLFNMNSNHNADILSKMSVWQNSCVEKHFLLSLGMEKKKNKKLNKPLRKALHRRTASTTYSTPISGDAPQKPKIETPNVDQRMKIDEIGNISQRMLGARHRRVGSTVTDLHLSPRAVPYGNNPLEKAISPTTSPLQTTPASSSKFTGNFPLSPGLSAQHADDLINSYTPSINTPSSASKPKNVELDDIAALVFGSGFASPTKEMPKTELKVATSTIKITTTSASPSGTTPQSSSQQKATNNHSFDNDEWGKNDSWATPSISTKVDDVKPVKLDSPGFENDIKKQPIPVQQPTIATQSKQESATHDDFGDFPEPKSNQSKEETEGWSNNDSWDEPAQASSPPKSTAGWANSDSWSTPEPSKEVSNDSWGDDNKWSEQPWEPSPPKTTEQTKPAEPVQKVESSVVSASEDDFGDFPEPKDTLPKQQDNQGFANDDDFGDFPEPKDHEPQQQDSWGNSNTNWGDNSNSWNSSNDSWASQVDSFKPTTNNISSTQSFADDGFGDFPQPKDNDVPKQQDNQGFATNDDFGDFPAVKEDFKPQADPWESQPVEPLKVQTQEVSIPQSNDFGDFPEPKDTLPKQGNQFANDNDFGDFPEPKTLPKQDNQGFANDDDFGDFPEPKDHEPHQQDSWGSTTMQPMSSSDSWISAIPTNVQTSIQPAQLGGFDDWLSPATVSTPPSQSTGTPQTNSQPISDDWLSGSISSNTIVPPQSTTQASDDWLSGPISTPVTIQSTPVITSTIQTSEDDFGDFPEPKDHQPTQQENQGFANDDDEFGDFPEPQDHVPKPAFNDGFGAFQEPVAISNIVIPPAQPKPIGGFDDWLSTPTSQSTGGFIQQSTGTPQTNSQPIADDWLSGSTTTTSQPSTNNSGQQNDLFEFF